MSEWSRRFYPFLKKVDSGHEMLPVGFAEVPVSECGLEWGEGGPGDHLLAAPVQQDQFILG